MRMQKLSFCCVLLFVIIIGCTNHASSLNNLSFKLGISTISPKRVESNPPVKRKKFKGKKSKRKLKKGRYYRFHSKQQFKENKKLKYPALILIPILGLTLTIVTLYIIQFMPFISGSGCFGLILSFVAIIAWGGWIILLLIGISLIIVGIYMAVKYNTS